MADTRFSSRQDLGVVHVPYETPGMPTPTEPSPQMPGLFIAMDPPDHTRLRRKLIGAFTVKRMKALEEQIVEIVERQLDELATLRPAGRPGQGVRAAGALAGHLRTARRPLRRPGDLPGQLGPVPGQGPDAGDEDGALVALNTYLGGLVTGKRANPGEDILSDLARDEDLSIEELVGIAFLLLLAGHETTANMLALGTFALLEHPDQLAELRANPDLMPDAVEELHALSVRCGHPVPLRGARTSNWTAKRSPRARPVVVSMLAANHDPKRFENPDTLDVHRKARGHLSFGHGVHQCLGQQLARIEMRAGFDGLLRRFPSLRLPSPPTRSGCAPT